MATYVNDLRLKEIATGDEAGTWGTSTNTNLELIAEAFSFGTEAITTNADTHTTTIADGSTDPGRSMFLKYTGTLDSTCTITIGPNTVSKLWFIENATSGSQNIIIKQGSGATITVPNGQVKAIYSDGAGSGGAMVDAFQDLSVPDLFIDDDLTVGDDLVFSSDSAVITFGADGDTTLTHTDGSGLTLNSTNKIMFNDASQFIQGSSATVLSLGATDEIDLTATAIDVNGTMDVSGALTGTSATFTTADNTAQMVLKSTDADSSTGPILDLQRDSGSPADSDLIGFIRFRGDDDGGNVTNYATIQAQIADVTGGTEDGTLKLQTMVAGSVTTGLEIAGGNVDISGALTGTNATFTTADNTAQVALVSTDADASDGPILEMFRNSSSPADDDDLGLIKFFGENDASEKIEYGVIEVKAVDVSDGTEDGSINFTAMLNGTARSRLFSNSTETVFNEGSQDIDFRVESDGNTHMLFVDAGNNAAVFGSSTANDSSSVTLRQDGTAHVNNAQFSNGNGSAGGTTPSIYSPASATLAISTNSAERARIDGSGNLLVGRTSRLTGQVKSISSDTAMSVHGVLSQHQTDCGVFQYTSNALQIRAYGATSGTGNIQFKVGGGGDSADSEAMRIDSSGNLLVGTTTASTKLTVAGDITATSTGPSIFLTDTDNNPDYQIKNGNGTFRIIDATNSHDRINCDSTETIINESSADRDFRVETDAESHGLFVDGGNSTVNINYSLGAKEGSASGIQLQIGRGGAGTNAAQVFFDGNTANRGYVIGTVVNDFIIFNETSSGTFKQRANFEDDETVFNLQGEDIDFRVESDATSHCLFVDANDDAVLFGKNTKGITTTGAAIAAAGTATFSFNLTSENESFILNNNNSTGTIYKMDFRQNNSSKGQIVVGSSSTAYNTSSDYRLKENVKTLKDGLSRLAQLKPVQFNWTTDGVLSEGFIAHEVDEVFPDAVTGEKDAVDEEGNIAAQQMDYGRITPLLVKAIQEQQEQIEELKSEIATLKGG